MQTTIRKHQDWSRDPVWSWTKKAYKTVSAKSNDPENEEWPKHRRFEN